MKYQAIAMMAADYPITRLCHVMQVSESGFYAWRQREVSRRHRQDVHLSEQIDQVYQHSRQTYGSPRIHAELQAQGVLCGRKRVIRLMRQRGLTAQRQRQRCRTTDSQHTNTVAPNQLARDFTASRPNEKWVADITGVWTAQGWLYVAVVLDVFSRLVVGWAMSLTRDDDLVLTAMQMALTRRQPHEELLHHSDRGSQYTSKDYQALLARWGIRVSMSRKGDCYDNAMMESFNATLKGECCDRQVWTSHLQARQAIFTFVEIWYNRHRRHSSLGYLSPIAFEQLRA